MEMTELDGDRPTRRRLSPPKEEQVRLRRQTLVLVMEKCRKALELLEATGIDADVAASLDDDADDQKEEDKDSEPAPGVAEGSSLQSYSSVEAETDELCALLKSKVESLSFLQKLGSTDIPVSQNFQDENLSWDIVSAADLWKDKHVDGGIDQEEDDYVFVRHEDIAESIACFMATYLLSLKQTKELSPIQLQEALSKAFSIKKKSQLWKAWEGSKVIYNVASWGATAVGIYQNPVIFKAASVAFWSSCQVISRLV